LSLIETSGDDFFPTACAIERLDVADKFQVLSSTQAETLLNSLGSRYTRGCFTGYSDMAFRFQDLSIMSITISINTFLRKVSLGALLGFTAASAVANQNYAVTGTAYNQNDNQVVYREFYTAVNSNNEVTVNYAKPDGTTFATKTLIYKGDPTQPEFEFHDQRDDEKTSAQFRAGRLVLSHSLNFATNEKTIMNNAGLVIDAGYDAFIQKNWDQLTSGKKQTYEYALPTIPDTTRLQVREVPAKDTPLATRQLPSDWHYFLIRPASKFSAIFANLIYVAYSPEKYLMRYYGKAPIDNDKGKEFNVRIEYEYW